MRALSMLPILFVATPALSQEQPSPVRTIIGTQLDLSATGIVRRTPDVATIGAGVVTQDRDAGSAMTANATRMTQVVSALRRAGVADRDIQTASLTLQPQYRYADNQPPTLTGYQASNRVSVRLRALDAAGKVLDALVAAGANQIDGPNFAIDKPEAALNEARMQALAAARARADLYARAAGLRVARIVRIGESGAESPPVRPMMMMASRAKADSTPIETGEQELSVTVSVTFELR